MGGGAIRGPQVGKIAKILPLLSPVVTPYSRRIADRKKKSFETLNFND